MILTRSTSKRFVDLRFAFVSLGVLLVAGDARAEIVPTVNVSTSKAISYYEDLSKKRSLTNSETEIFSMLKFGQEALKLKSLHPPKAGTLELSIAKMDGNDVAFALSKSIESIKDWAPVRIFGKRLSEDSSTKEILYKFLGSSPFERAWLEYQQGNKDSAIKILSGIFDDSFKYIMAEDSHLLMPDQDRPLIREEHVLEILKSLTSKKDQVSREKQLNEMREHLKKIPIHRALA